MKTVICDIPSWRTHRLGRKTLQVGYPWLTFGAIISLEILLTKEMRVLELGCGGSTLFFGRRCKEVVSIETDFGWADKTDRALKFFEIDNVALHRVLYDDLVDFLRRDESQYDVLLVDHVDPTNKLRRHRTDRWIAAREAMNLVKLGGLVVIDNYDSHGMKNFPYDKWDVFTYDEIAIKYTGRGTRICRKMDG